MKLLSLIHVLFALVFAGCQSSDKASEETTKQHFQLYLLIGQSNMAGRGMVEKEDTLAHPRVFSLDSQEQWIPASEPLHFDKPDVAGVGPGFIFGKAMAEKEPQATIGLIPCAAGGSPIAAWQLGGYHAQTHSYPYDEAVRRAQTAMKDGVLKGILWHQGESDSSPEKAAVYQKKLIQLITNLRDTLGNKNLPVVVGTLGSFYVRKKPDARLINDVLLHLPKHLPNVEVARAAGLTDQGDSTHFDSASARILGQRYAEKMWELQKKAEF